MEQNFVTGRAWWANSAQLGNSAHTWANSAHVGFKTNFKYDNNILHDANLSEHEATTMLMP